MLGGLCSPCCANDAEVCNELFAGTRYLTVTVSITNISPLGLAGATKIDGSRPWLDVSSFTLGSTPSNSVEMPISLDWRDPDGAGPILQSSWYSNSVQTYENGVPDFVRLTRPQTYPKTSSKWCHVWYGFDRNALSVSAQAVGSTLGAALPTGEVTMVISEDATEATFEGVLVGRVNISGLSSPRPFVSGGFTTVAGGLSFVATIPFGWSGFNTLLSAHSCSSFLDSGYGWSADIEIAGVAP